jgi:hypothetical protein
MTGIARPYARKLMITFITFCSVAWFTPEMFAGEPMVYITPQSFTWREFVDGQRVVKESGYQFGVGFTYPFIHNALAFTPRVELFGGTVDYDGQACDDFNNCQPATADVDYFGLKLEAELGASFRSARGHFIEPFGGLGMRAWSRDLVNATAADGSSVAGYTEHWLSFYGRVGVRGGIGIGAKKQVFLEAGAKLPFYNQNTAYVSDIGLGADLTLHPGEKVSFFSEAGIRISRFQASLFYDSFRFPQSPTKSNGVIVAYQPESEMDLYGFKAGWIF